MSGLQRRAAFAFALGSLFFAYAFALRVSPSVMVSELMRDFAMGAAVLGNLSGFYFYAYAVLQIPVGLMLDRFGIRLLMSAAAAAVGLGCWLFASSDAIAWGYAARLIIGAGCAFSWAGTLAIVNYWFPTRFALLAGVSQMGAMAGGVMGQAPLGMGVEAYGWREAMTGLAVVGVVLAVSLFWVIRDKPADRPAGYGTFSGVRGVLANRQTWLAAAFSLTMTGPLLAFGGLWGVPFLATAYDLALTQAAGIASLVFVGNGVGAIAIGWWSDRIQRRRLPMICGASLIIISQVILIHLGELPVWALAAMAFLIGVGGSSLVMAFAVGREHNSAANVGLTIGVINTATVGSGALFQPIIGVLLDWRWSGTLVDGVPFYEVGDYRFALSVLPATSLVGLLIIAAIKETHAKRLAPQ